MAAPPCTRTGSWRGMITRRTVLDSLFNVCFEYLLASGAYIERVSSARARKCFAQFEANEARLCGEWAVFYHSCAQLWYFAQACQASFEIFARYSFAALIYEVHAAVGSVLFRFRSQLQPQLQIMRTTSLLAAPSSVVSQLPGNVV